MKFGVLGTGMVGMAVSGKLAKLGHDVVLGSSDPGSSKAREVSATAGLPVVSYAEAAAHGEWVVNALRGEAVLETLGGCHIAGKILIDISNYYSAPDKPIDPPIGEAVQEAFPGTRVVKALNSVSAHLMVDPASLGKPHSVFVAGNDQGAKTEVSDLLRSFGWVDIIDLGGSEAFRAMEQLIPLWMALEKVTGGVHFNLSVSR